jgi:hypothetical protein
MAEQSEGVRRQLLDLLLEKVAEDTYPSSTMLDLIELLVTPDEIDEYSEILMAKIEGDTYPSNSLIRRLVALT